jgi:hypothetical protein
MEHKIKAPIFLLLFFFRCKEVRKQLIIDVSQKEMPGMMKENLAFLFSETIEKAGFLRRKVRLMSADPKRFGLKTSGVDKAVLMIGAACRSISGKKAGYNDIAGCHKFTALFRISENKKTGIRPYLLSVLYGTQNNFTALPQGLIEKTVPHASGSFVPDMILIVNEIDLYI